MKNLNADGSQLVADFQTAVLSLATSDAAIYEANRSEEELMAFLSGVSRGAYLQPSSLDGDEQQIITQASVDAHLKKAQAEQVQAMSRQQIMSLEQDIQKKWRGRKIAIQVLDVDFNPIRGHYFDQRNGSRLNGIRSRQVSGKIDEVLLDKNILILKPSAFDRLTHSGLKDYIVTVVDPNTFIPVIKIT